MPVSIRPDNLRHEKSSLLDLSHIRIVLVETSHPGNIGAVARAMKTMGLSDLWLVSPRAPFPHAEATSRASGADDLLCRAQVVPSLDEALADRTLVFGASARMRQLAWPLVDPRQCGALAAAPDETVAVVFGREDSGLSNAELGRCNYLVHIPTNPDFGSLNIAAAVQVIAYELRQAAGAEPPRTTEEPLATAGELAGLFDHLERTLVAIGFLDPANPRQVMQRLRRLFKRARPNRVELNILRGVLTASTRAVKQKEGEADEPR